MNSKGFGLDEVTLLIDYNEYRYLVTGDIREKIERIDKVGKRPFDMVNVAKKHGILVKDEETHRMDSRIFSCDDEETLMKKLDETLFKHHGILPCELLIEEDLINE